jgi:hypothetical protein
VLISCRLHRRVRRHNYDILERVSFRSITSTRRTLLCVTFVEFLCEIFSILPAPVQSGWDEEESAQASSSKAGAGAIAVIAACTAPPYGDRKGWVPRRQEVRFALIVQVLNMPHSWTMDVNMVDSLSSVHFVTILIPISLFICALHFWVELKSSK